MLAMLVPPPPVVVSGTDTSVFFVDVVRRLRGFVGCRGVPSPFPPSRGFKRDLDLSRLDLREVSLPLLSGVGISVGTRLSGFLLWDRLRLSDLSVLVSLGPELYVACSPRSVGLSCCDPK